MRTFILQIAFDEYVLSQPKVCSYFYTKSSVLLYISIILTYMYLELFIHYCESL